MQVPCRVEHHATYGIRAVGTIGRSGRAEVVYHRLCPSPVQVRREFKYRAAAPNTAPAGSSIVSRAVQVSLLVKHETRSEYSCPIGSVPEIVQYGFGAGSSSVWGQLIHHAASEGATKVSGAVQISCRIQHNARTW